MEKDLNSKMTDFMTVIEQVKKYRAILRSLPDFTINCTHDYIGAICIYFFPFWIGLCNLH